MLKKIALIRTKYKHIDRSINEFTNFTTTIKTMFGALLISLVLISVPALLIYNLFVFHKIRIILYIATILVIWVFSFIYNKSYDLLLKSYHEELNVIKTKTLVVIDSIFGGIVLTVFAFILMTIL